MAPIVALLYDIKFSHTIFAMPFAILGAFMAATNRQSIDWPQFAEQLTLIVLCMVFARTLAMLANRILDRKIDATNPRTVERALPSGRATSSHAIVFLLISALLFIATTTIFGFRWDNWLPTYLSIPVLVVLSTYPLLKRFTWSCHFYLGASLAISPIAAAIAIQPAALHGWTIWLLAGMVLCWVAGFDIIYALQDVQSDRRDNVKSIPAIFGKAHALRISQLLHLCCLALLYSVAIVDQRLGSIFLFGVVGISALLVIEHLTVKHWGTTKIAMTFFTINGIVSCLLCIVGIIDLLQVRIGTVGIIDLL